MCRVLRVSVVALGLLLIIGANGCKSSNEHTSNPQLRQIDELLSKQLPPGTALSRLTSFLNSRGYVQEEPPDRRTLVAIIEHVSTDTLQPSAARVTFHFDAHDRLLTYDMTAVPPSGPH